MLKQKTKIFFSLCVLFVLAILWQKSFKKGLFHQKQVALEVSKKEYNTGNQNEVPNAKRKYKSKALPILITNIPEINFQRDFIYRSFFIHPTITTAFDALKYVPNKRGPPVC
jgi:hypothetical protein